MNIYHFWGTEGRMELVSVNGRPLMPAPAGTGNLWQRYSLILLQHEYNGSPPVSHLVLARYLPAGKSVIPDILPFQYEHQDICNDALELTSDDLVDVVSRVESIMSRLQAVDDPLLLEAISSLDYRLANSLMDAGIDAGRKTLELLVPFYNSYTPEQNRHRRQTLRVLLRQGLDPCVIVDGRSLLHHLCAGSAHAQDVRLLLDAGAHESINRRDASGDTPLLSYCRRQDTPKPNSAGLSLLLDHGADPDISNQGETAYTLLRDNEPLAGLLL